MLFEMLFKFTYARLAGSSSRGTVFKMVGRFLQRPHNRSPGFTKFILTSLGRQPSKQDETEGATGYQKAIELGPHLPNQGLAELCQRIRPIALGNAKNKY